jgi:hypothetical protein
MEKQCLTCKYYSAGYHSYNPYQDNGLCYNGFFESNKTIGPFEVKETGTCSSYRRKIEVIVVDSATPLGDTSDSKLKKWFRRYKHGKQI